MTTKTCIFDHEIHEIISETNEMYQLRTITAFPREYFVPKDQVEFKEPDVNLALSKTECRLVLACINLMINQFDPRNEQSEKNLKEIRAKIEMKLMNERN